jgi:AcrR family transcriptional regulator
VVVIPTQTYFNLSKEKQQRIIDAAVNEFSVRRFQEAKVSNIIKEAKIPRGSFYQYFEDKLDIYKHIFYIIGQRKMEYMTEDLKNPMDLAFFDLFRKLYHIGLEFALGNPKYIKISSLLLAQKDLIYQEVLQENIVIALDFYKAMIIRDQELGRMDKNIDPETLANLVINMTMNVTFDSINIDDGEKFDEIEYKEKLEKIIYIFEKGIKGN